MVSLSGGADSAAVACLSALLVHFGMLELGRNAFLKKLGYVPALASQPVEASLVRPLLTCVYQSTRNSSDVTRRAARTVAESLGAEHLELDVDRHRDSSMSRHRFAAHSDVSFPGTTDDIALQNIQARVRSPSVWMLANSAQCAVAVDQ